MFKMKGELSSQDPFEVERNQSALRRNENELKLDTKNELKKTHLPIILSGKSWTDNQSC